MTTLMHIDASPSKPVSSSANIARALIDAYTKRNPDNLVHKHNVWELDLPPFDASMIAAKFAVLRAQEATVEQKELWAKAVSLSQFFNSADHFVFSLPMWNFGIPYRLKHFIDVITLPGQNWSWSMAQGYKPLLSSKRAVLIYSSAGDYPLVPSPSCENADFQKPYMREWLKFIGIDVVDEIVVAPTLTDVANLNNVKEAARLNAIRAAAAF